MLKAPGGELYEGDCLEVMPQLPAHSVDMILSDLPYGTTQNKWDSVIPLDKLWHQYRRLLKPRGVVALTSQGLFTARLILSNESWFRYKYVWIKSKSTNFLNARRQPLRQHEDICIFYERQPDYRPVKWRATPYNKGRRKAQYTGSYGDFEPVVVKSNGDRFPTDALYCKTAESESLGQVWHPTQKPVALGRYLIRTFTKPNDTILDNAFGSGSFLVSALVERRRYIGIEKNQDVHLFKNKQVDYIEVALQRLREMHASLQEHTAQMPISASLHPSIRVDDVTKCQALNVDRMINI